MIFVSRRRYIKKLSHCYYECKYHIVFTPKYRGKILVQDHIKTEVKRIITLICKWKDYEILEMNIQDDHIHLVIIINPKNSLSYAISIIKGKSSAWIKKSNRKYKGLADRGSLWARGYFVSTIGIDEIIIRRYVKHQGEHNQTPQPNLWSRITDQR